MLTTIKHKKFPNYKILIETDLRVDGLHIWAWPQIANINKDVYATILSVEFIKSLSRIGIAFQEEKLLIHVIDKALNKQNITKTEHTTFNDVIFTCYFAGKRNPPKSFLKQGVKK